MDEDGKKTRPKYEKPPGITQKLEVSSLGQVWHKFRVLKDRTLLLGSFSETHRRYRRRTNGFQTPCNCVVAIVVSKFYRMSQWDFGTIDQILELGDQLYVSTILHQRNRAKTHLLLCEVYPTFYFYDTKVTVTFKGCKREGRLYQDVDDSPFLSRVIVDFFNEHESGILTVDKIHMALWYIGKDYYLFDPAGHDRDGHPWRGLPGMGFAAVMRFKETESLVNVIHESFGTRSNPGFVLTPCSIIRLVKIEVVPPAVSNLIPLHCPIGEPEFAVEPYVPPPKPVEEPEEKVQVVVTLEEEEDVSAEVEASEFAPEVGEPPTEGKVPSERPRAESVTYFAPVIGERMGILRASTHQHDQRYTKNGGKQSAANAIVALAMLRLGKSRRWFRRVVDEILKCGERIYVDSAKSLPPGKPLKVTQVSKTFKLGERVFTAEIDEYATIGRLRSTKEGVLDLLPALEEYFRNNQTCVVTGPLVLAIWAEDGRFYMFDPNERDKKGLAIQTIQVGSETQMLRFDPGAACVTWYSELATLVDVYMKNVEAGLRREPFFLSKVVIRDYFPVADPWNGFQGVARDCVMWVWILRGSFHQNDRRFEREVRGTQCTAAAALALAFATLKPETKWTTEDVDEILLQAEPYYKDCVATLKNSGRFRDRNLLVDELNRKCALEGTEIIFEIEECVVNGLIDARDYDDALNLRSGIATFFRDNTSAIVTARSASVAIWKKGEAFYYYDSHSRDEKGLITSYGTACVMRFLTTNDLATIIEANLHPGPDNTFNIARVTVSVWEIEEGGISRPPLNNYHELSPYSAILRSAHSERSDIFKLNAGRQTIPMCLAALAMAKIYPASIWSEDIFEEVLRVGDRLFTDTMVARERRADLPPDEDVDEVYAESCLREFRVGANKFAMNFGDPLVGNFEYDFLPQIGAFYRRAPTGDGDELELLITSNFYNVATWFDGNVFYLFDPKPRDPFGQVFGKEEWSAKVDVPEGEEGGVDDPIFVAEMARKKLGGGDQLPEVEIVKHSPSFWRQKETDGAACVMWFTSADKLIEHVYENTPPNRRDELDFKMFPITVGNRPDLKDVFKGAREDNYSGDWYEFKEIDRGLWILRGTIDNTDEMFPAHNRGRQSLAMCYAALAYAKRYVISKFKSGTVNDILKYGDRLHTATRKKRFRELRANKDLGLSALEAETIMNGQIFGLDDVERVFCIGLDQMTVEIHHDTIIGDIYAEAFNDVLDLRRAMEQFFQDHRFGILTCKTLTCALWKGVKIYYMFDSNSRGPCGLACPSGEACITRCLNTNALADVFLANLPKEGRNGFAIHSVRVRVMQCPRPLKPEEKVVKDEPPKYTGATTVMPGKHILRGTFSQEDDRFGRGRNVQSAPVAIIALSMSLVHKPSTWTTPIVDDILFLGDELYMATLDSLGYDYNPWEKGLTVHLVSKDYKVGLLRANFGVRTTDQRGMIDIKHPSIMNIRQGMENFFEENTHGVIETETLTVAIWEEDDRPGFVYMYDPNPRGPAGLYLSGGTACLLVFETIKMAADHFIANVTDKSKRRGEFVITPVEIVVGNARTKPRKKKVPVCPSPDLSKREPTTPCDKMQLRKMAAEERKRKEARRLAKIGRLEYHVLSNGDALLRGTKSQSSKEYSANSRGNQDIANCFAAFVVHRLSLISTWHYRQIDMILDVGDQLYKDSYITYNPRNPKLGMANILRKVFIKDVEVSLNVYRPVMTNTLSAPNLELALINYFQQEQFCVLTTRNEHVALFFREGLYYTFDPHDCDLEGNRCHCGVACIVKFQSIANLVAKYVANYARSEDGDVFTITLITLGGIVVKGGGRPSLTN